VKTVVSDLQESADIYHPLRTLVGLAGVGFPDVNRTPPDERQAWSSDFRRRRHSIEGRFLMFLYHRSIPPSAGLIGGSGDILPRARNDDR
jgi:hypothetical protein